MFASFSVTLVFPFLVFLLRFFTLDCNTSIFLRSAIFPKKGLNLLVTKICKHLHFYFFNQVVFLGAYWMAEFCRYCSRGWGLIVI